MMYRRGFTIIELLIVITVIAVLTVITIVTYNGIQDRARASAVASDLKKIEKAFRMYGAEKGWSTWPIDTAVFSGSSNPDVNSIIANVVGFKDYLQPLSAANATGASGTVYLYDNDLDTYTGCSGVSTAGVNIYVDTPPRQSIMQAVDAAIDDGNLSCGKVTYTSSGGFRYNLSPNPIF